MTALFEELGAPLKNKMWSWGAIRESDQTVFLRVWQDGTKKFKQFDGKYYTWISDVDDADQSLGANERRQQVAMIRGGSTTYMVMCQAEDDEAMVRVVLGYDDETLHLGGAVIEHEGKYWLENVAKIPVRDVRIKR